MRQVSHPREPSVDGAKTFEIEPGVTCKWRIGEERDIGERGRCDDEPDAYREVLVHQAQRRIPEGALAGKLCLGQATSRTILPMCSPASMRACAAAAWSSGKWMSMTGRSEPSSTSGHTLA